MKKDLASLTFLDASK